MQPEEEGRPGWQTGAAPSSSSSTSVDPRAAEERAALALRCAWLRANAWEVDAYDPTGALAAQLRDLADLLEVAEREGWFDRRRAR